MITIKLDTGNAAFEDDAYGAEVARILEKLAAEYRDVGTTRFVKLYDGNGNAVGTVTRTGDDRRR